MRCLLKISIPVEVGNARVKDDTLPKIIQSILQDQKPEAAYFAKTMESGQASSLSTSPNRPTSRGWLSPGFWHSMPAWSFIRR